MRVVFRAILVACSVLAASAASARELKVGSAAVRITPPIGGPMAGYYYTRLAKGTLDDLYAKAIVIDDGANRAAMVACDLIGVPATIVEQARQLAFERTGIPVDHIMISATHAHTGPSLIDGSFRTRFEGETLRMAQGYLADLPVRIAEHRAGQPRRRPAARRGHGEGIRSGVQPPLLHA